MMFVEAILDQFWVTTPHRALFAALLPIQTPQECVQTTG